MAGFTYGLDVQVNPQRVRVGQEIAAAATLTGATEPVLYVDMRLAGTGYTMKMRPMGPGKFGFKLKVPPIVPTGCYTIEFYAVNRRAQKGPIVSVPITVTV